jgi:hypothetical protein
MANEAAKNAEDAKEELADQLRRSVANAYAFVKGQEMTESFSALTFEELLDKQIERIEGPGTDIRPNVLDRIRKVKADLIAAVVSIKSQPDDFFKQPDATKDAVTAPEPVDPLDSVLVSGTTK